MESSNSTDNYMSLNMPYVRNESLPTGTLFREFSRNHHCNNINIIYGPAGIGKTTCLENEILNQEMDYLKICVNFRLGKLNTGYEFIGRIWEAIFSSILFSESDEIPTSFLSALPLSLKHKIEKIRNGLKSEICADESEDLLFSFLHQTHDKNMLFIFEDIHLIGDIELERLFLRFQREDLKNIQVVCTSRKGPKKHDFSESMKLNWLELLPYNEDALSELFGCSHSLNKDYRKRIYELSQGNPFFIKEALSMRGEDVQIQDIDLSRRSHFNAGHLIILKNKFFSLSKPEKEILTKMAVLGYDVVSNLISSVFSMPISKVNALVKKLENHGFLRWESGGWNFSHHLFYEYIHTVSDDDDLKSYNINALSYYKSFEKKDVRTYERLAYHAMQAGEAKYIYLYNKILAEKLISLSNNKAALASLALCHDVLEQWPATERNEDRRIKVLLLDASAYSVLGELEKAKEVSFEALFLAQNQNVNVSLQNVYSKVSLSLWASGDIEEALKFAQKANEASSSKKQRINTLVRLGGIYLELGEFNKAIQSYEEAHKELSIEDKYERYGILTAVFPTLYSNLAYAYAAMYDYKKSRENIKIALEFIDDVDLDTFSKLYIVIFTGKALYLLGDFKTMLPYLEQGLVFYEQSKGKNIGATLFSLLAACNAYIGRHNEADKYLNEAKKHSIEHYSFLNSFVSQVYLEILLLQNRTKEFEKVSDIEIKKALHSKRYFALGWMYYYKAVFYAFYKPSLSLFIDSLVNSTQIADERGMGDLIIQARSLVFQNSECDFCDLGENEKKEVRIIDGLDRGGYFKFIAQQGRLETSDTIH